jgi:hypothetical protein
MDSVELYERLLGLTAPWTVEQVELDMAKTHVEVHVGHLAGQRFACPKCGRELGVYDHLAERVWRHLDRCQSGAFLSVSEVRSKVIRMRFQTSILWVNAGDLQIQYA